MRTVYRYRIYDAATGCRWKGSRKWIEVAEPPKKEDVIGGHEIERVEEFGKPKLTGGRLIQRMFVFVVPREIPPFQHVLLRETRG